MTRIQGIAVSDLIRRGWTVTKTRRNHWKLVHRNGSIVFASFTPGDHRSAQNFEHDLRKAERRK